MILNSYIKLIAKLSVFYTFLIKRRFYYFGKSKIYINTQIDNPAAISIQDGTVIRSGAWLLAIDDNSKEYPKIQIGNHVYIGRHLHLTSIKSIIIEDNVLIADKVYISDNNHGFNNIQTPIKKQSVKFKNIVVISEGSWIGENACIIGCSIGRNSIVGANAVVLKDVPDYSIVAGNPARILKRYDLSINRWRKTNLKGEFIDEK